MADFDVAAADEYAHWANSYLEERNIRVFDLDQDISDGVALLNLVELLADGKGKIGRFYSNPVARIQKLDNVSAVLKFLDRHFHIEPPCSAEEVVDGNIPAIMDLMEELVQGFDPDMEGPYDHHRRRSYSDDGSRSRSLTPPPGYVHGGPMAPPMVIGAPMPIVPDMNAQMANSQMAMLQTMQSIQAMQAVQSQQSMMNMMMGGGMAAGMGAGMGAGMPGMGAGMMMPPMGSPAEVPEVAPREPSSSPEPEEPRRTAQRRRSRSASSRGSVGAVGARKKRGSSKGPPKEKKEKEAKPKGRTKERTAPTTPRKRSSSRGAVKKPKKEAFDPSITGLAGGKKTGGDGVVGDFDGGATLGGDFVGTSNIAPKKRGKKK